MNSIVQLNLPMEDNRFLYFDENQLAPYQMELIHFLEEEREMNSLSFAKKMMMSQEIKANNNIEGMNDDLTLIDEVIKKRNPQVSQTVDKVNGLFFL